ncbi:MAG: nickel pincer cofactor biosynthesis protein LarC [Candidatus Coatesbacteria bacterium]|nr:MAG: nickel pincer cofactor biosynthesis protein LarC [Candidatus Coatesbacteria bacterium]
MKVAYFDCFSGAAGDMFIGSLLDAGLSLNRLKQELSKLKLSGVELSASKGMKGALSGTKFNVEVNEGHVHRHLHHITEMIDQSELSDAVKARSKAIFEQVAKVEGGIHHKDPQAIHFHEVGALDSIVDIVGSVAALEPLGVERAYCSRIHVGTGFVKCQHGEIPVPAPATLALLKGLPVYSRGIEAELVTPTGAALLRNLCVSFGTMPPMKVDAVGYGLGTRDLEIPNMLRVVIGDTDTGEFDYDQVVLLETNIDDMSPELLSDASEAVFGAGALDVFVTPTVMKKGRAGFTLSVLTSREKLDECLKAVFVHTSTLGVRISEVNRRKLFRESISVDTRFGPVDVKVGRSPKEVMNIAPEYESCRRVAVERGVALKQVYDEATLAARKQVFGE